MILKKKLDAQELSQEHNLHISRWDKTLNFVKNIEIQSREKNRNL